VRRLFKVLSDFNVYFLKKHNFSKVSFLLILIFLAIGKAHSQEFAPHFTGEEFKYLGEYFHNYTYLMAFEDGEFCHKFSKGTYSIDVFSVREEAYILCYLPSSEKFSIVDLGDPAFKDLRIKDLNWSAVPENSILVKACMDTVNIFL